MTALEYQEAVLEEQLTIERRVYRVRVQVIPRDSNLFIGLALQDISDLVRLNRARREMVANISARARTPIANIRLIIDSLFHEDEKPNASGVFLPFRRLPERRMLCCGSCRKCSTFL